MKDIEVSTDRLTPIFQRHPTNYQSNFFTESRQEFTHLEKKIVTLVVNQVGYLSIKEKIVPGSDLIITIPFSELTHQNNYIPMADAAESLQSKRLMYRHDKNQHLDIITPFPRVRFDTVDGRRVIELTMFSAVVPHFAELGQRYTRYECDIMLSLSSVYSQRMFEIVSMYYNRKQLQFSYTVTRLMEMLNCPEQYNFNDFRKNALVRAKNELQDKANFILDWAPRKEGKKIVELIFTIKDSQAEAKGVALEGVKQDQQVVNQMSMADLVRYAYQKMKNYKLKDWQKDLVVQDPSLLETFYRVDSELANRLRTNIKNPTAYLVKSLCIDQLKAPRKTAKVPTPKSALTPQPMLSFDSTSRSATPQSIAAIFGATIMNETK